MFLTYLFFYFFSFKNITIVKYNDCYKYSHRKRECKYENK